MSETASPSRSFGTRLAAWFALGFALVCANAAVTYYSIDNLVDAKREVIRNEQALRLLGEVLQHLLDAETGQRGYIITGEERYLEPYNRSTRNLDGRIAALRQQIENDPEQSGRIDRLRALVIDKLDELNRTIAARRQQGAEAASRLIQTGAGKVAMDRIRIVIGEMESHERVQLARRAAQADNAITVTVSAVALSTLANLGFLGAILYILLRDAAERRRAAASQEAFNQRLTRSLEELRERNQEITLLSQMSSFLQSCTDSQEACAAIARMGPMLFPTEAGRLYLYHASRNYLDLAACWGETPDGDPILAPEDCWGLRRGRAHEYGADNLGLVCAHVQAGGGVASPYLCVPMMAQGETLGLLHLRPVGAAAAQRVSAEKQQVAVAVAEQVGLALANLTLRDTLRQQSIRDALTGLYNRRFLEESLDRELGRLARKKLPLAVIMIDVDHFKRFNDTHGHEAGDVVLRDLGLLLRRHLRQSDVACRLGGEEFTILMPETDVEIARRRAEFLRGAARELKLVHDGRPLGEVTLSLGVAAFPEHGADRESLLHAADMALYEAKRGGRDRVVVYTAATPPV
jgi:diguanylate cyclase (GGDEF)-like protein